MMTNSHPLLIIGTRGSPLALAQAHDVRDRLCAAHPDLAAPGAIEIKRIKTVGDSVLDRTLSAIGGKGLFTKEIEQALEDGSIDLAVHSMKDVATILPDGLIIDCFLPREDPRDAFFGANGQTLDQLPPGSVVGTASLRRAAQVLFARPDLKTVPFRGNVQTRLSKLADGVVDATLLAVAGLNRLGESHQIRQILSHDVMLPAVAQGAVGVERRQGDDRVAAYLAPLNDPLTTIRVRAERATLAVLDGTCRTPIGAIAEIAGNELTLTALIIRPDGTERHKATDRAALEDAEALGRMLGLKLKAEAGPGFFDLPLPDEAAR